MVYKRIKRLLDIIVSAVALLFLAAPLLLVAIYIKLESAGPVLFRQLRYGRDKVPFECLKFRTMYEDAPANSPTRKLKDSHSYISRSGKVLRRTGFDELPQLINILRGEMSLIGPRPVVLTEEDLIRERDKYGANAMTPGIGGWAQSNGRDEVDIKEKARLDGEYAQNFGWRMDISCIWRTAVAIFTSEGFKEGGFGDTPYRREVRRNTHRINFTSRVVRRIKRDLATIKKQPARARENFAKYRETTLARRLSRKDTITTSADNNDIRSQ